MTIQRLFNFLALAVLLWLLLIGAVFLYTVLEARKQSAEIHEARNLLEVTFYLNWLTSDYSSHAGPREETQWLLAEQRLDRLLHTTQLDEAEFATQRDIGQLNADLTQIFTNLREIKQQTGIAAPSPDEKRLEDLLIHRLAMKAEELFLRCFDLDKQLDTRIHIQQYHALVVVIILILLMALALGVISIVMQRKVVSPLQQLSVALTRFTCENAGTTLALAGSGATLDEISAVQAAFNEMRSRLALNYAELTRENSERIKAEQLARELLVKEQAARSKAEEMARLKDEFLMGLSHELRTPLNAVLGFAELIQRGALSPDKAAKAIDIIVGSAKAELALVNDILDLSACMAGTLQLHVESVDLGAIAQETVETLRLAADGRHITLRYRAEGNDLWIAGDRLRLGQIISNLLTNAIKFTPENGPPIDVVVEGTPQIARLIVRDQGIGIGVAFLPYVFDKFRQEDGSVTRKHGGLGVGLNIVHNLVELHGGSITAESSGPGCGALFTVIFPRKKAAANLRSPSASPALSPLRGLKEESS